MVAIWVMRSATGSYSSTSVPYSKGVKPPTMMAFVPTHTALWL